MSNRVPFSAVVAMFLTLAGVVCALFGPAVYRYPPPATMPTGSASLWSTGPSIELVTFVLVIVAGAAIIAIGASLHAAGSGAGTALAWLGALVVVGGAIASLPGSSTLVTPRSLAADIPDAVGIGVYFIPAAIASIAAAIASGLARRSDSTLAIGQF